MSDEVETLVEDTQGAEVIEEGQAVEEQAAQPEPLSAEGLPVERPEEETTAVLEEQAEAEPAEEESAPEEAEEDTTAVLEEQAEAELAEEESAPEEAEEETTAVLEEQAEAERVEEDTTAVLEEQAEAELAEEEATPDESGEPVAETEEELARHEGRHWYVIHSYSGYENKVKKNLDSRIESMGMQDYIFEVVVPTEEVVELRDGRRRTVEQRIFPGYILVDMILNDESWFVVRNTPGVTGFVGSGNEPTPLRQEEADSILRRIEEEAPRVKVSFRVGDAVRITDGPFTDFMGTVDDLNLEKGKVRLLVSFFGRETPVELDFLQVETE
jgi:transcriptional antiterminator NusG